jgi:prolyl-tRNA editing enzyme YbaK/EbsC (Cys-tRNA(Pro) deacylase)
MTEWPEEVERVAAFLRASAAEGRIEEFGAATASAADAADAVGCEAGEIVKSLVVIGDGRPFLALIPGDRRADLAKIARATGTSKARIAKPDEVLELTGFAPGAVAPFPLPQIERILVDRLLLASDGVWVGAGSTRHMAVLPTPELVRLTKATPADLVDEL